MSLTAVLYISSTTDSIGSLIFGPVKQPLEIDLLKNLVTRVTMLVAVAFNILPEM